jgi:hypothetical protein
MADKAAIAALEREAFTFRSIQARGNLVKMIGEDNAGIRAQAWGLRNLQDFKTAGVKPDTEYEPDPSRPEPGAKPAPFRAPSKNPWSAESWSTERQRSVVKGLGLEKASELAAAAGSFVGATSPKSVNLTSFKVA